MGWKKPRLPSASYRLRSLDSRREWDKRQIARALDGHGQQPLMRGAGSRETTRQDLASIGHELAHRPYVLVIDEVNLFFAKLADFAPAKILLAPAARASG